LEVKGIERGEATPKSGFARRGVRSSIIGLMKRLENPVENSMKMTTGVGISDQTGLR
jgi:hypothetical protein